MTEVKNEDDWGHRPTNLEDCPFCGELPDEHPYMFRISTLSISSWYLSRDQGYRGACLIIFSPRHAETIEELEPQEFRLYCDDLYLTAHCVRQVFQPDHMNYALLGNVARHLHWHLIPRYRGEARWGMPVWTTTRAEMQHRYLDQDEYEGICRALRLKAVGFHL